MIDWLCRFISTIYRPMLYSIAVKMEYWLPGTQSFSIFGSGQVGYLKKSLGRVGYRDPVRPWSTSVFPFIHLPSGRWCLYWCWYWCWCLCRWPLFLLFLLLSLFFSLLLQWHTSTLSHHLQSHQDVEVGVNVDVHCHTSTNMHLQTRQVQFSRPTCCCKKNGHTVAIFNFVVRTFLQFKQKSALLLVVTERYCPEWYGWMMTWSISLHQWTIPKRSILKFNWSETQPKTQ